MAGLVFGNAVNPSMEAPAATSCRGRSRKPGPPSTPPPAPTGTANFKNAHTIVSAKPGTAVGRSAHDASAPSRAPAPRRQIAVSTIKRRRWARDGLGDLSRAGPSAPWMARPEPPWMGSRRSRPGQIAQAVARLQTILDSRPRNPGQARCRQQRLAGGLGFEPRLAESESAVLPLDDPPPDSAGPE